MRIVADRACQNCPPDGFSMIHAEIKCPLACASQDNAAEFLGKARVARSQQRLADNMDRLKAGKPVSYMNLLAFARRMDEVGA